MDQDLFPVALGDGVFPCTLYEGVVFRIGRDVDCGYGVSGLRHVGPDGVEAGKGVASPVCFFEDEMAFICGNSGFGQRDSIYIFECSYLPLGFKVLIHLWCEL